MKIIVSVDKNWGIGCNGKLQVRNTEDLKRFEELTINNIIILGSNTLLTFPEDSPLPNRINIILDDKQESKEFNGNYIVNSLDEIFKKLEELKEVYPEKEVYVIGGASVYKQLLDYCNEAIITKWDFEAEADVYFPNLNELDNWQVYSEQNIKSEDGNFIVSVYQNIDVKKR